MACPVTYKRTDHINICVPIEQLEEAREFYQTIIGLQQIERPDVFATPGYWFAWADIELHIGVEPALPVSARHTAFEVTDVAAARRWLEQNHIKIYDVPLIKGRVTITFYDPFGNHMELLEYV